LVLDGGGLAARVVGYNELSIHCVYPGIGKRWLEPDSIKEIWYQSFNQQPWAASLVGRDRATCRTYFRHFLDHWAGRPGHFDEDLEAWVDNFMKPGNLQGGFNWYVGIDDARTELWRYGAPNLPKIEVPTRFFWGEEDTLVKIAWADRLGEYFSDYSFSAAEGAGLFVHYEEPEAANREIVEFFSSLELSE
jgi:pimeloyl-ACP methyl ester carboxylesterase